MEKCKLFFFWRNPETFFKQCRSADSAGVLQSFGLGLGGGCRRRSATRVLRALSGGGAPKFGAHQPLISSRAAPRVSSDIERGLPPNLQAHQPLEVASSVSSEAPSSIERSAARICSTSTLDFSIWSATRDLRALSVGT